MDQGRKGHRKYAFLAGERMGHPGVPVHVQVSLTGIGGGWVSRMTIPLVGILTHQTIPSMGFENFEFKAPRFLLKNTGQNPIHSVMKRGCLCPKRILSSKLIPARFSIS